MNPVSHIQKSLSSAFTPTSECHVKQMFFAPNLEQAVEELGLWSKASSRSALQVILKTYIQSDTAVVALLIAAAAAWPKVKDTFLNIFPLNPESHKVMLFQSVKCMFLNIN